VNIDAALLSMVSDSIGRRAAMTTTTVANSSRLTALSKRFKLLDHRIQV
jgi:hypothetical protein